MTLPGVGRKNRQCSFKYRLRSFHHCCRYAHFSRGQSHGNCKGKKCFRSGIKTQPIYSKEYLHDAHHWLILHGRYICTARKPKCLFARYRICANIPRKHYEHSGLLSSNIQRSLAKIIAPRFLSPDLEKQLIEVILQHPEYHRELEKPDFSSDFRQMKIPICI